jgi:hypothetical protein
MNPLIRLRKTTPIFLVTSLCFGLLPVAQAQLPLPAPDGFYPGFNTAEGRNALKNVNVTTGTENTAIGFEALLNDISGDFNTATGSGALHENTTGQSNTANGRNALYFNNGDFNTAVGRAALARNTTGRENTATGFEALNRNETGGGNTAMGAKALFNNIGPSPDIGGSDNTAIGYKALYSNTIGFGNTAVGSGALLHNSETAFLNDQGFGNSAFGAGALSANDSGSFNTAIGDGALAAGKGHVGDTAVGSGALSHLQTAVADLLAPGDNIALGDGAGSNLTKGSFNIYIGSLGGDSEEFSTIRIGGVQHFATFIAGISGQDATGGDPVFITSAGKLGTVNPPSSARFKEEIKPMDHASEVILALKPVTFRYKKEFDPTRIPQFGLVAEEVEKVNPDLVKRDREGKVQTVRYEAVNAMLLNEFLKEHRKNEEQEATIARQQKQIEALTAGLQRVSAQLELSKPAPQTAANAD